MPGDIDLTSFIKLTEVSLQTIIHYACKSLCLRSASPIAFFFTFCTIHGYANINVVLECIFMKTVCQQQGDTAECHPATSISIELDVAAKC